MLREGGVYIIAFHCALGRIYLEILALTVSVRCSVAQAPALAEGVGKVSFRSFFPIIGRGNILRDSLATSTEIDAEIDKILV